MKEWSDSNCIFYPEDAMKIELYEIIISNPKLTASVPSVTYGKKIWAYGKNRVATKCKCKIPGHVILAKDKFSLTTTEQQMLVCKHIKEIKKNYVRDRACDRQYSQQFNMNIRPSDFDTNWADEDKSEIPALSSDSN